MSNPVQHPDHYNEHPSGIECIEIVRHMGFNLGNAMKYIWRADLKDKPIEDLEKAMFYIQDEINKRKAIPCSSSQPQRLSNPILMDHEQYAASKEQGVPVISRKKESRTVQQPCSLREFSSEDTSP